jgi:CHAT domain-containing protein
MYSKALPFYEEVDNTIGLGNIYSFQGDVYLNTGKYQKALEMYSKALPFFEKMDDPLGQGDILVLQGIVYSLTGNNQKALEMYSKALLLFEKADDPRKQGFVYLSQGNIYSSEGDNNRSLEIFSKALPLLEQADDVVNLGNLYKSQGEVYYYLNDNQRSLEMYSKAISFYEKGEEPLGQGDVYKRQADIFARTGENQKAIDMYSKALTFYEKANAIENEAFLLLSKAELFEKTKQLKDAYDNYVGGLAKLEKVRTQIGFSEMKMGYQEKVGEQYSQAINFMLVNNYDEKAFEYYENTKARTLLDQITEKKMYDVEKGIDSTLKMRRDEISSQLSFCQSQLTQTTDSAAIEELKTQYKSLDDEFEKVKQDIRFKNPLYAAINYPQAVAISKLRSEILNPEEALLQYYFSEDSVFVFVITNDNFEIVKLPASRTEIEQEAANFNERVLSSKKDPYVVSALYQEIIEPLKNYIEDKKTLIIVPDGLLSFIPFEAIYAEGGEEIRYLLEDYNIKYIQSGTMLSLLRKEFEKENTNNSFIGFGDPVYDYENYLAQQPEKGQIVKEEEFALLNRDGYERSGGKLDRLEGSGQEVDEISKMFGTKPYLRLAANEEMVKSAEMKNYGYILFSCHGLISDEFQSLVLSQIPESKEDGYLTLGEITNLDWNAKLVVLSACQTGKGKVKKGEGVVGMTRAIMLAGTPAAVVSLWNVSDQGTKELMVSFFRNINEEEMTKEEALRKAKLEMLKTDYKNPYYWSAFVMYGE